MYGLWYTVYVDIYSYDDDDDDDGKYDWINNEVLSDSI